MENVTMVKRIKRAAVAVAMASILAPAAALAAPQWNQRFGDSDGQFGEDIATDGGDPVIIGSFRGGINFGSPLLTSLGDEDIYLAKFDGAGNHLWSKSFGDTGPDAGQSVAVDGGGNILATGYFTGSINFNNGAPPTFTAAANSTDMFVAKFDSGGNHLWSISAPNGQAFAITTDSQDNVWITGQFWGTTDFGCRTGSMTSSGNTDVFLVKLDPQGNCLSQASFGDNMSQGALGVATDQNDNVVIVGVFYSSISFASWGPTFTSAGGQDAFVAKFDANGSYLWSTRFYGIGTDTARDVAIDGSSNIVVTGNFSHQMHVGTQMFTSAGNTDVFAVKLTPAGGTSWVRTYGDSDYQFGDGVAIDPGGRVFLTGGCRGGMAPAPLGCSSTFEDVFLLELSGAGAYTSGGTYGNSSYQSGSKLAIGSYSAGPPSQTELFLVGDFLGSLNFGLGPMSASGQDVFTAKFLY